MSTVLESQPYAIYPIVFNPYEVPSYKRLATFSKLILKKVTNKQKNRYFNSMIDVLVCYLNI